jgi:hypothetical protein
MFKAASRIFAKSLPLVLARTVSFCTLTPRGASRGCAIICIGRDDSWPVPPPDLADRRMRGIPYFPEFIQRLLGRRDRGRRIDGAFGRFHRLCGRAERVSEAIEEVYQKTQVQAVHCVPVACELRLRIVEAAPSLGGGSASDFRPDPHPALSASPAHPAVPSPAPPVSAIPRATRNWPRSSDCLSDGLAISTRLSGRVCARGTAFAAAIVDFPHCREQFRIPRFAPDRYTSACRASRSSPVASAQTPLYRFPSLARSPAGLRILHWNNSIHSFAPVQNIGHSKTQNFFRMSSRT